MAKKGLKDYEREYLDGKIGLDKVVAAYRRLTENHGVIELFQKDGQKIQIEKKVRMNERGGAMTKVSWWNLTGNHCIHNVGSENTITEYIQEHLHYLWLND